MQRYYEEINACNDLDTLFKLWREKESKEIIYTVGKEEIRDVIDHRKNRFIPDGIVDPVIWKNDSHKKIMYVLKEARTSDPNGFDLAKWLSKAPDIKIWNRIAIWTYGIQNTTESVIKKYNHDPSEEIYNDCFKQISVINLKKSDGDSQSCIEEIAAYAESDKEEIKKEFELIDPDIVICGYTYDILLNRVFGIEAPKDKDNRGYYIDVFGRERLFIDYYHPGNHFPDIVNYYAITNIYQQSLLSKE